MNIKFRETAKAIVGVLLISIVVGCESAREHQVDSFVDTGKYLEALQIDPSNTRALAGYIKECAITGRYEEVCSFYPRLAAGNYCLGFGVYPYVILAHDKSGQTNKAMQVLDVLRSAVIVDNNTPGLRLLDEVESLKEIRVALCDVEPKLSESSRVAVRRLADEIYSIHTEKEKIRWPKTIDAAVDEILMGLTSEDKRTIRDTPKNQVIGRFHFDLGMTIRNDMGLWRGNMDLLQSCGSTNMHPDNASGVILEALWERLQTK